MKTFESQNAIRGAIEILSGGSGKDCPKYTVKYSELVCKEVYNLCNGCKLGQVGDMIIDCCSGSIEALLLPLPHKIFEKCRYKQIPWEQVKKIGKDAIIVFSPDVK